MTILNKEKILEVARAFIDEGKYDRAIREYEKLLLADPTDLRVKLRIAELYTKRKQIAEAIRIYREVAEAYAAEGFYLKAVTVHKNVLRLNPSLTEINEQLAILYERMGLVADAVRQYDILATALDIKGQHERVLEIRQRIVKLIPQDPVARVKLAELFQREKRVDEAIEQYEELARQLEETAGDRRRLVDLYEKILSHRPDRHEMLRRLIDLAMELGDAKRALEWLESSKELSERDPELLALMARIYASQNQNETARTKLVMLADLEAEGGNTEAALDAYVEILTLLPEEEDRIARRVEELKEGALPEVVAKARQRREEREREEALRQGEAQEAWPPEAEKKRAEKKEPSPAPAKMPAKEAKEAKAPPPVEASPAEPAPPSAQREERPPTPPPPPARRHGDAAFDLGIAYRQMGLGDEAAAEFAKAKEIYLACREAGASDPDIPQRLAQIEAALSGGAAHAEQRPAPSQKAPPPAKPPPERAKAAPAAKKKKVSFV